MSIAALFSILKYFGPAWFKSIANEAQSVPATVAGLAFIWVTITVGGFMIYNRIAMAEETMATMQQLLAANTKALECSSRDRQIGSKFRELTNLTRLMELATDDNELRSLRSQYDSLQSEIGRMERVFETNCLNGNHLR